MIDRFFKILLYISFLFLIIYLFQIDYISLKEIKFNYTYLGFSLILLFIGFYFSSLSWWNILHKHQYKINSREAVISHGMYIFSKYIPGKLWVVMGRAGYLAKTYNGSLKNLSVLSLKEQLLYILLGLWISLFPTYQMFGVNEVTIFVFLTIIGLTLILYLKPAHRLFIHLINKLLKKNIEIPILSLNETIHVLFYILIYWSAWSTGYYFLAKAVESSIPFMVTFVFPVSVVYGVLAIVAPGGIGVREGIIVLYFTQLGIDAGIATTIAVLARLWYIVGEFFLFTLSQIFLHQKKRLDK